MSKQRLPATSEGRTASELGTSLLNQLLSKAAYKAAKIGHDQQINFIIHLANNIADEEAATMADHEHSAIKHGDHLLLDQPLLRLPNELLRKNFRSAHFTIEKDTAGVKTQLRDTANSAVSGHASQAEVLLQLDTMLTRMRGVKRKLTTIADEEARLHGQIQSRIAHLDDLYDMRSVDDVRYEAWSRKRLDRLLADYLLRRGCNETAAMLAEEKGMRDLVDVETFQSMSRIRDALSGGSVTEALAWCADNKKELRKMESKLEFMLRFQQYIELVRSQTQYDLSSAIAHSKKHLIPHRDAYPNEMKQICGLLAFRAGRPSSSRYADLYRPSRWKDLADLFTTTHNSLLALPSVPLLHVALSSGLSALKTPACHSATSSHQGSSASTLRQGVCPICSTELNDMAKNVPYAHHTKSHVEHDLRLLPNGRVYGKERLEEQAKKAGLPPTDVKDLHTGEIFPTESLKKVYIT